MPTVIGALDGAHGVAVTADGTQVYVAAEAGNDVSHFTVGGGGNLIVAGCTGDLPGCTATNPPGALDGAYGVAMSWAGGDLYATSWWGSYGAVSHFKIDPAGNLIFAGCVGDYPGCAATTPKGALDGADAVALSADGANLYATAFLANDVSHFTIKGFV